MASDLPENSRRLAPALLDWFERHGRKDLPWQQAVTPYRVWVSEVMLQQTQVATVIPYFRRFIDRFPTVEALANASLDEVLAHWTGLGYYARARHLHETARRVMAHHGGSLPAEIETLRALPGIGRSTAGAILALAHAQPHAILDGNARRVLARFFAVGGWPGAPSVARHLWELASACTPAQRVPEYTQAMMDLGATVCTRRQPRCGVCPLAGECSAHAQGRETDFPGRRARKALPVRTTTFLILLDPQQRALMERRPPAGLWGGLWSFPECPSHQDPTDCALHRYGLRVEPLAEWAQLRHSFTHFHLDITPCLLRLIDPADRVMEGSHVVWYKPPTLPPGGFAAPVVRLLAQLPLSGTGDLL